MNWREQILQSNLSFPGRCAAFTLSVLFDRSGSPLSLSLMEVAEAMGSGRSVAQRALREAVEAGLLVRRKPKAGRGHRYEYEPR